MLKIYLLLSISIFSFSSNLYSRTVGSIYGKVIDYETKEPVIGATIRIEGTSLGQYTNKEGNFKFPAIPVGNFTLLVSYVGYATGRIEVAVKDKQQTNIDIAIRQRNLIANEVVVTANKKIQSVQEVPISISIIEGNIFEERSITRLDEALKYLPSVEVNNDNISIRGSSGFAFGLGSRAILLLDGFPLLSGDNGDIKSDAFPIPLIDQIEVVKGAGSALYGASALGGVINIITKEPSEKPMISMTSHYGIYTKPRFDQWQFSDNIQSVFGTSIGYAQKIGQAGLSMSISTVQDEGYRFYNDEKRYSGFIRSNFALSNFTNLIISGLVATNNRADWVYWQSLDSATRPPSNTDLDNRINSNKYSLFSEIRHIISDKHFISAKTGAFVTTLENNLSGDEYRQSTASTIHSEVQANSKLNDAFHHTYGLVHLFNNVESFMYGNRKQQTVSAYSQIESPLGDLILTYGARLDFEQTEGLDDNLEFSPKFGLSYKTGAASSLRLSVGRGFRPASIAERFASLAFQGFEVIPNEKLKSERSWSFEIGINQPISLFLLPALIDFAFYNNEMFDLIEPKFVEGTHPSIQFLNTTRARITGLDFSIKSMISSSFGIDIGLSAMHAMDLDSNTTLKYRSPFSFILGGLYKINQFDIMANYRFKSKSEKVDDELKLQIKDHSARVPMHVLDFGISYHLSNKLPIVLSLNVHNLFDYYYTEVPGNLGKTRTIIFQIGYRY